MGQVTHRQPPVYHRATCIGMHYRFCKTAGLRPFVRPNVCTHSDQDMTWDITQRKRRESTTAKAVAWGSERIVVIFGRCSAPARTGTHVRNPQAMGPGHSESSGRLALPTRQP